MVGFEESTQKSGWSRLWSQYIGIFSPVRVNGTFSDDFLVNVGLHQGSVLTLLLFVIVLEHYLDKLGQDAHENCFMLITWH